jgi:hypothetical protein
MKQTPYKEMLSISKQRLATFFSDPNKCPFEEIEDVVFHICSGQHSNAALKMKREEVRQKLAKRQWQYCDEGKQTPVGKQLVEWWNAPAMEKPDVRHIDKEMKDKFVKLKNKETLLSRCVVAYTFSISSTNQVILVLRRELAPQLPFHVFMLNICSSCVALLRRELAPPVTLLSDDCRYTCVPTCDTLACASCETSLD